MTHILEKTAGALWGPFTLALLLVFGAFIALKMRFYPIAGILGALKETVFAEKTGGISPMLSLWSALAATMGAGNIVGVATAVAAGGAGALFWMELSALAGMMIKYAEALSAARYRSLGCGPLGYLRRLGGLGKPLTCLFAVFCLSAALLTGNMTQSNSAGQAFELLGFSPRICAVIFAAAAWLMTGEREGRVMRLTACLTAPLTFCYLAVCIAAIWKCRAALPTVLGEIIRGSFGLESALGGAGGLAVNKAVRFGLSRGIFSNEAGMGTSPIAYSLSSGISAEKQGCLGALEVFIDTVVCCSLTGLVLLLSGADSAADGALFAINAFSAALGEPFGIAVAVMTALFALASVCGWYIYGALSLKALVPKRRAAGIYRILYALLAGIGVFLQVKTIWLISDILTGMMLMINLFGIIMLSGELFGKGR